MSIQYINPQNILENSIHMSDPIADISNGVLPEYLKHNSLLVDDIRAKGCTWIVNGSHCRQPCVPFLFLCSEHKNIPDFQRHVYNTLSTCKKRK